MPSLSNIAIVGIPLAGLISQYLAPKVTILGLMRDAQEINNGNCVHIPELKACEDAWIQEEAGLAYLPCSDVKTRQNWLPAVLHMNAGALPAVSNDYLALYDFNTGKQQKLTIKGLPSEAKGIYVHAIDIYESKASPEDLTVFINSHRPPKKRSEAHLTGADSVIEIFETKLGSGEVKWVQTVKHELIRTPNNLAVVGPRQFYFSNDHKRKVHWSRKLEALYAEPSDLIYCDASGAKPHCITAASGLTYPNGVAKGPGNLIYSVSSLAGNVHIWERQADNTLALIEVVPVPRPIDNMHVSTSGALYLSVFPKILDFLKASSPEGQASGFPSPVEVWKVSNQTSDAKYFGGKWKIETVFGDKGKVVSGCTSAAPYRNKVLLTGVWTKEVVVCDLS